MIQESKIKLYHLTLEIMNSIVNNEDSINSSFKSYIIDTAVAIKYSGIIVALLANEQKKDIQTKGFKPPLVNNLIFKILKEFYSYPCYFNYNFVKDLCLNPYYDSILKRQMLDILSTLKDVIRSYNLLDDYDASSSFKLTAYTKLVNENNSVYNNQNINENIDNHNRISNLRVAYYNYCETNHGFRSWFDRIGIEKVNESINSRFKNSINHFNLIPNDDKIPKPTGSQFFGFELAVDKRGLLIGTGYPHFNLTNETDKSDFQMGLFFDYNTGIPMIPSSSIKGFLASFFQNLDDPCVFGRLIDVSTKANINNITVANMNKLAEDTFGTDKHNPKGTIFFDAYITGRTILPEDPNNTKYNYIVDEDWLAPHLLEGKRSKLCEPIPIRFLKIAPGVKFKFSFVLKDTVLNSSSTSIKVTAAQKSELFKILLLTYNLGAKHRTGFGKFIEVQPNPSHQQSCIIV